MIKLHPQNLCFRVKYTEINPGNTLQTLNRIQKHLIRYHNLSPPLISTCPCAFFTNSVLLFQIRTHTYRIYVNTKRPKNKEEIHDIYAFPHIFNKKFIFCRCIVIMHSAEFTDFSFFPAGARGVHGSPFPILLCVCFSVDRPGG